MTLSKGESDKNAEPVTSSVATATPQPIAKGPPKSAAKEKKVAPKQKVKKPEKKAQPKKPSKHTPATPSHVKGIKFSDPKSKIIMTYVAKRKLISERLIKLKDYEKAGIVQLFKDRELFDSVCIAKPYSQALVREFYANLKKRINDIQHPMHELVFVRGDKYDFCPVLISSILCTKVVRSIRTKELDLGLDMNMVTKELTGNLMLVWPELNVLASVLLTTKYVILHKITVANWMPRLHITTINKDLAILLYAIGTDVPFIWPMWYFK